MEQHDKQVSTNTGPKSAGWFLKKVIFKQLNNNDSFARLVECQTVVMEVPGSNSGWGEFFLLNFF